MPKKDRPYTEFEDYWTDLDTLPEGNDPFPQYPVTGAPKNYVSALPPAPPKRKRSRGEVAATYLLYLAGLCLIGLMIINTLERLGY